jgi:hypothetical protein
MTTNRSNTLSPKAVTVSELIAQGYTYEQILVVQPTLTYLNIFNAAQEALEVLHESLRNDYDKRLAQIRKAHPRAYEKWSDEEETKLIQLVQSGISVKEISSKLQRQPSAIRSRMMRLGLNQDGNIPE